MGQVVIGVDEVGRGCLAGPVVAAAVFIPQEFEWLSQVKDSKKLTAKKREHLSGLIKDSCFYSIKEMPVSYIDEVNILWASLEAMRLAVEDVPLDYSSQIRVLVDGSHRIPNLKLPQEAIPNGDNLHKSIAAASIIAKVYRDNKMVELDKEYPEYGFAKHKGYGTEEHRVAIMVHGPTPIHRKSFRGVYEYVKS